MNDDREVRDQDDVPMLGGSVTHPRPGHLTDYERKPAPPRKPRINWFVLVLCLAVLAWFVFRAVMLTKGM